MKASFCIVSNLGQMKLQLIVTLLYFQTVILFGQRIIEGTINDANGKGVSFAAVGIANSTVGTITNSSGRFNLAIPESYENHRLIVSHVSFARVDIDILNSNSPLIITLKDNVVSLNEVVVEGLSAEAIMIRAIDRVKENYNLSPLTYTVYSSNENFISKEPAFVLEAVVKMHRSYEQSFGQAKLSISKLRGRPSSRRYSSPFRKARTTWLTLLEYVEIEKLLNKKMIRKSFFELDTMINYKGRMTYKISANSDNPEFRKTYFVDAELFAVCRTETLYGFDIVEYQLIDDKWYFHMYFRGMAYDHSPYPRNFVEKTTVTDIQFGENNKFESLGWKVVQEVKHRIEDWNDSFWEDYNYIVLDDIWME